MREPRGSSITRKHLRAGSALLVLAGWLAPIGLTAGFVQGQTYEVLHSFSAGTDGETPQAGVIHDAAGNLYGTTSEGGTSGYGTVFELDPAGTLTVLHSFNGTDGAEPVAGLIPDGNGNLYGTTAGGGTYGHGTVFKLDPNRTLTVLHSFHFADGATPSAGLIRGSLGVNEPSSVLHTTPGASARVETFLAK